MNRDGIYGDIFEDKKDNSVKGDAQGDKKTNGSIVERGKIPPKGIRIGIKIRIGEA